MYVVVMGDERPKQIRSGTIEKNTGQTVLKKENGFALNKSGTCIIPNKSECWGRRVVLKDDGKVDQSRKVVNVTDVDYKGVIECMKFGHSDGYLIKTRYLSGYRSLDLVFQETRLGYKFDDTRLELSDAEFLSFQNGENVFDEKTDELFIKHLKNHSVNRDSVSKAENVFNFMFYEKNFEQIETFETKASDERFEAGKIVREAVNVAELKNLYNIIKPIADEDPSEEKLYNYLVMLAERKSKEFLGAVSRYKGLVSESHTKLQSFDAVDLTVDGKIATGNKPQKTFLIDVPGKGEAMLKYMYDNILKEDVYNAQFKILQLTEKLK